MEVKRSPSPRLRVQMMKAERREARKVEMSCDSQSSGRSDNNGGGYVGGDEGDDDDQE